MMMWLDAMSRCTLVIEDLKSIYIYISMVSSGVGGNPIIIQGPPISPGPPKLAVLVYGARETEFRYQRTMKFDLNSRQLKTLN